MLYPLFNSNRPLHTQYEMLFSLDRIHITLVAPTIIFLLNICCGLLCWLCDSTAVFPSRRAVDH